jgi:hypothetical protein
MELSNYRIVVTILRRNYPQLINLRAMGPGKPMCYKYDESGNLIAPYGIAAENTRKCQGQERIKVGSGALNPIRSLMHSSRVPP